MQAKISWGVSVDIAGGPQFSPTAALNVDAYDLIDVAIDKGGTKSVDLQPSKKGVSLLLILAGDTSGSLKCKLNATVTDLSLDSPFLLVGDAITKLLGSPPQTLTFTNSADKPVGVRVLVGRVTA